VPLPEVSQQIGQRLEELYRRHLPTADEDVAKYYVSGKGYQPPERGGPQRDRFGICLALVDGSVFQAGDWDAPFALQSISKVFAYGLALADNGREQVLRRVGVEPSGNAFNSFVFDEHKKRPFNPMVNAGALATTDLIHGSSPNEKLERILDVLRCYAGNDDLAVDPVIFAAEQRTADRNRATAYLMRSDGMLHGDVEPTLSLYLQQCSVQVTCRDLAIMAATLANGAVNPITGHSALPRDRVRDVLAVMYTCGMYDFAGEWAYSIGVPAKSGVSGGVLVVIPGKMGVGVFSPGLDRFGNSVRGTRVCQELSERLGLHLFATDAEDSLLNPAKISLPSRRQPVIESTRRHRHWTAQRRSMPCSTSKERDDTNAGAGSDRL
jgi:glutaminase